MNCSKRFKWNLCIPTYNRSDVLKRSFGYLFKDYDNVYTVCNREGVKQYSYMKNVVSVPDEVEGRLARKNNWILENLWPAENDFVVLMDDDQKGFSFLPTNEYLSPEEFVDLIEFDYEASSLIGAGIFGMLTSGGAYDMLYSVANPFSFHAFIDGTCIGIRDRRLHDDPELHMRQDIDLNLLNRKLNGIAFKDCRWKLVPLTRHGLGEGGDRSHQVRSALESDRQYLLEKWKHYRRDCLGLLNTVRYASVGGKTGGY